MDVVSKDISKISNALVIVDRKTSSGFNVHINAYACLTAGRSIGLSGFPSSTFVTKINTIENYNQQNIIVWFYPYTDMYKAMPIQYFPDSCENISQVFISGGIQTHDLCYTRADVLPLDLGPISWLCLRASAEFLR